MYSNELFANKRRSYSGIFKKICDYKHDLERIEGEKIIKNSIIYKKIIKDFKFYESSQWLSWGSIEKYNCKISYRYIFKKHTFYFFYTTNFGQSYKKYILQFSNRIDKTFESIFLDQIKSHLELKPFFMNSVLVGERRRL